MFKPTLRQLEYFYSLSKTLSFSQSAEDCFVGQSTLSSAIKDLEDGIGFPLFERTSRKVFLTSQGEQFLTSVLKILDKQDDLLDDIQRLSNPAEQTIRLGIIPTIAPFLLPKLLKSDIKFTFREGLSAQLIEDLEEKRIDVALFALPYPVKSHFKTCSLFEDDLYIARPKSHTEDTPFIFLEDGHCLRDQAITSCSIKPDMISQNFKGSSLNSVLSLVECEMGQTLIPEMSVPFFSNHSNIEFVKTSPTSSRTIALIWEQKKHAEKASRIQDILS
ncbi:MAG: LysR family transcriptional regulator [Bdellovibrionales bacterium]